MAVNHRMERITEIVQKEKNVTVNYLSKKLGVTEKTIRLDLEKLEKTNVFMVGQYAMINQLVYILTGNTVGNLV